MMVIIHLDSVITWKVDLLWFSCIIEMIVKARVWPHQLSLYNVQKRRKTQELPEQLIHEIKHEKKSEEREI